MRTQVEQNIATVKAAYAASAGGDWENFFAAATDATEFHEAPSLPYAGVYRGVADIKRGLKLMFNAWDDFSFQLVNFIGGDDLVVVHVIISGIGRKTGKSFSMPILEMWRFRDGKITEIRPFYYDTARCAEVYG